MSKVYKKIGASGAGFFHAGYGFNLLRATADALMLYTPFRHFYFAPNDIVSFVPEHGLMGQIQILHSLDVYPANIYFRFFGDPEEAIADIAATGFKPGGRNVPPRLKPEPGFVLQSEFSARR